MIKICPALLVPDVATYRTQLGIVRQLTNRFQLDVIDGEYVENRTVELSDLQPMSGEFKLDIHLMVRDALTYVEAALRLKPNIVVIQLEGGGDISAAIQKLKSADTKVGLAINPKTDINELKPYIESLYQVLILGVEAGFSGQSFQPLVLPRASAVRQLRDVPEIAIDGGVNSNNITQIDEAGYDIAYVASYIFKSEDPLSRYGDLLGVLS